jgi:hypothetical protein
MLEPLAAIDGWHAPYLMLGLAMPSIVCLLWAGLIFCM